MSLVAISLNSEEGRCLLQKWFRSND